MKMSKKKSSIKTEVMQPSQMYLDHERTALKHLHDKITRAEKRILLIAENQFTDNPQYLNTLKECKFIWQRPRTPKFINGRYNADQWRYYRVTLRGVTALETLFGEMFTPAPVVKGSLVGIGNGHNNKQAVYRKRVVEK